jgi:hypothetical protein
MKNNKQLKQILKEYKINEIYAVPVASDLLSQLGKGYDKEQAKKLIFMIKEGFIDLK